MILPKPKLVCLDTSTWIHLAKGQGSDASARGIIQLFNSGKLLPFFTWHHIEELCQYPVVEVYQSRVSLIRSLRFVTFPKLHGEKGNIGDMIDLRRAEISALREDLKPDFNKLAEMVRLGICNGFCSGEQLYLDNYEWWQFYRTHFAALRLSRKAEIASVTHFPFSDQKQRLDRQGTLKRRTIPQAKAKFEEMARTLAEQLKKSGDLKGSDPDKVAADFMRGVFEEGCAFLAGEGEPYQQLLEHYQIDPSRLPNNATNEDEGYEGIFMEILKLHEEDLRLSKGTLRASFKQDMIPSWVVWREVDRGIKAQPKAESGNVTDKMIIPFALYVDALECDKRVRDSVDRAARKHWQLGIVKSKLFQRKTLSNLLVQLEQLANT